VKKQKHNNQHKIVNRRARFDYELGDSLLVGIVLTGRETKALRQGHGQLRGAFVTTKDGELWLVNSTINSTNTFIITEDEQTRSRKLLAKSKEISAFMAAKQQGRTIVPLEFLTQGRHIKLKIAIGKGKKHYDKRQSLKKHDQEREIARSAK
jgi:SsrA-binding protein